MNLESKIAVVTGGASGMGKATADALRQRGVRVMVWDRQLESPAEDAMVCDVSSSSSVENALQQTIQRIGIPRICINCAGIAPARRIVNKEGVMPLDLFKQVIDINLVGTFNVMRVVIGAMMNLDLLAESEGRYQIHSNRIAEKLLEYVMQSQQAELV